MLHEDEQQSILVRILCGSKPVIVELPVPCLTEFRIGSEVSSHQLPLRADSLHKGQVALFSIGYQDSLLLRAWDCQ